MSNAVPGRLDRGLIVLNYGPVKSKSPIVAAAVLIRQATMYRIDVFVAASFLLLVLLIVIGSAVEWYRLLVGRKRVELHESEFVPLAEVATS